jgi:hypothetical protein
MFFCPGFNRTSKIFPSVEEFNEIVILTNKSQSTVVITIPLIADMIALEDLEAVFLQMEVVHPVPVDVQLVDPTSAVIYVLDDGESLVTCSNEDDDYCYVFIVAFVSVGFSVPIISVLEGVGLVTVCINKSADTIVPFTVHAEPLPLTANSETGSNHIYSVDIDIV